MMGEEGSCGSLHSLYRAREGLTDALMEMLYRPWNIPADDWKKRRFSVDVDLFDWGHSGIWNYHVYRRYEAHRLEAEKQLAQFYRTQYGLDEQTANGVAGKALAHALVSGFDHGSATDSMTNVHVKLLTGESVDMFAGEEISRETDDPEQDSLLTFAIGHPELVRFLLGKGLDPDHQNAFGKTPLMYAAQFDEVESAKILLEHGAMVEAATIESGDTCNYTIGVKNVSPLHYAVRYASKVFIDLLLEHGAPTYVKDSKGKTPYDYLQMYGRDCGGVTPDPDGKPPEWNTKLTSKDCAALQATLLPPEQGDRGRLSAKANLQAEQMYREGKLKEAYAALKRAISLDPGNERARANQSLVALKLGRLGESAQLSTALIASATSDAEKANAYFNLGLACRQAGMSGNHYETIDYDGEVYCWNEGFGGKNQFDRSAFANFINAYRLQPTQDRLDIILRFLSEPDLANGKRIVFFNDADHGVKSLYLNRQHWYFLVEANKEVPFKKLAVLVNNKMEEFVFADKEVIPLSTALKLEHWSRPSPYYGNWVSPLNLDNSIYVLKSSFVFAADTRIVQINSTRVPVTEKPRIVVSQGLNTPTLLLLYGNGVDWTIEGDLKNIKGVYVHGYSSFYQSESRAIPVYADNQKANYGSMEDSMQEVKTLSELGLPVSSVITVDESGKAVVGE
jgi:tetratricopeptide (TPR) repeat protein